MTQTYFVHLATRIRSNQGSASQLDASCDGVVVMVVIVLVVAVVVVETTIRH